MTSQSPDGVIINQQFADAQHLRVGDEVSLVTPQGPARACARPLYRCESSEWE